MSDLYRSAISSRLSKLPAVPPTQVPWATDDGDEEEEIDSLGALPGSGLGPPAMPAKGRVQPKAPNPKYEAISASGFFAEALQVAVPARKLDFRAYYTPPKHADGTVFVCHHGAGYAGTSFACMAQEIGSLSGGVCGVLAVDARRHGKTMATEGSDEDLSIETLVDDFCAIVTTVFPDTTSAPSLLLVGHSMGGAVVVRSCPRLQDNKYRIAGVAVLDVVEGSAVDALPHMHSLLNARPDGFGSIEGAIEWHVTTNTITNSTSARVSIPAAMRPTDEGSVHPYTWRTPLRSTAPYWLSWFQGLSAAFLAARTARLLVLAGTDRLDKELMIGQMQGRFQMVVVPGVGHMLHEDDPTRLAEILIEFWRRNDRVLAGIKKVGDA